MRLARADRSTDKGWFWGPWNSTLLLSVGFANTGIDEPHACFRLAEIYLAAQGTAEVRVEPQSLGLRTALGRQAEWNGVVLALVRGHVRAGGRESSSHNLGEAFVVNAGKAQDPRVRKGALRWLLRETVGNLILIAILFGIVGRWNWPMGWALSGIYIVWSAATAILILPVNPAMLAERSRPHPDTPKWDVALLGLMGLFMVAQYVVASLDVRWGWSPPLPWAVQAVGLLAAVLGYDVLAVWSMVSNAFFVATVRIQTERGHTVASGGPYRYVRHPGYLGTILFHLAAPFFLGSLWALIPGALAGLVLVARTHLEDDTLHRALPGYRQYASRVRFRLLPGVW
ncbi:MAG: isoprenylcysteine carboxylmethyltransferase family protein [Chloroflexi bacterium]|nr:isoprenylcysteine carboxylmethyltransferase family protein [Chloroflexota bacterium]